MIKMPWKTEKTPITTAEQKLKEISDILFPPLETDQKMDENGTPIKFHVDYSVDSNIEAALADLYDGHNDEIVQSTLRKSVEKIYKVRKILEAYPIIDENIKYIIVDTGKEDYVEAAED